MNYIDSPRALLAVAFPPQRGLLGACATLADLSRAEYRKPQLMTRRDAVRLIFARNLESCERGKGYRAIRRMFRERRLALMRAACDAEAAS